MRALLLFAVMLSASHAAAQEPAPPDKARIRQLIDKLGDNSFAAREAAQRELTQFAEYAATELGEAANSSDLEQSKRAKQILGWVNAPNPSHRIVDALGQPIKTARFVVHQGDAIQSGFTDLQGGFAVPNPEIRPGPNFVFIVEMRHPEYGIARCRAEIRPPSAKTELIDCKMPLVPRGSDAVKRAVHGQVVDGLGKPVSGAVLHCPHLRTQGQGLMTADSQSGDVVADARGSFTLYLAHNKASRELKRQGELVPPGSRYNLAVTAPGRDDCFPVDDMFSNDGPVEIRLPLATRIHRFRFPEVDGGEMPDSGHANSITVDFFPKEGDPHRVRLVTDEVAKGRKLIPGKYVATLFQNGKVIQYSPMRLEENSPEVMSFQIPKATVYRGRAVHGVTGEPMGRVWAASVNSISPAKLAGLTETDWLQLRAMPDVAGPTDAATKILGARNGAGALVRTDDAGRFEITEPPGVQFYDLLVFAEHFLPIGHRVLDTKRDHGDVVEIGDLPLFPAAILRVKIASPEKSVSVMPEWKLEGESQPDWIARFRAADDRSRRRFFYDHWMTLDKEHSVFIPSGVSLRVEFRPPYDEHWGSASTKVLQAKQGEIIAPGEYRLPKSLPVSVRVVDHQVQPIEGLAVRPSLAGQRGWGIAHNTDAKGLAHFFIPPHTSGRFRVDFEGPQASSKTENLEQAFQIGEQPPESPLEFRLTAEQIRQLPSTRTNK